jgi:hypothetical protein
MVKTSKKKKVYKRKKTTRNKNICSPMNKTNKFTCFSKKSLIKIIESWNTNNPKKIIKYNKNANVSALWNKLDAKFKKQCDSESCWLTLQEVKSIGDEEIKETFRPKMPEKWKKNKNEWLTTIDIQNVLRQYQKYYHDFLFIGAVPIDFDNKFGFGQCVVDELCNINLKNILKKGKNKMAIVFNLDAHDKPGSHWVALYCDFTTDKIIFFDSYGSKPPNEIQKLMDRLKEQASSMGKNVELIYNKTRHQYKNSECGVYCLNFIINLLEGVEHSKILNTKILDDMMEKNRTIYFVKL